MIGLGLVWACGSLLAGKMNLEIVRLGQSVQVTFQTESGRQYQILTTTDVDSGQWVTSGDAIEGTGQFSTFNRDISEQIKTF